MKEIPIMKPYFDDDEAISVADVLASGWVAQGKKVAEFEEAIAFHEGSRYGVAVTSCTTALHLSLISLGVGAGDDVLVPSLTFVATANAVIYTGATPVLVDVDEKTFNIDVISVKQIIESNYKWEDKKNCLINKTTGNILKVIIPVHLFGLCADMIAIQKLSKDFSLMILEDSACSLGARIGDIYEGSFGVASCLSFHPRKSITTGEGGMVLTKDFELAQKIKKLRSHGASISEINRHNNGGFLLPDFDILGYNYRMTDIQASIGISQMKKLDWILEQRRKKAQIYNEMLATINWLTPPYVPDSYVHTYQSYVCMLNLNQLGIDNIEDGNKFRNELMLNLEQNGIATRQGTHAVHTLGYYKQRFGNLPDSFPISYKVDRLSITLPLFIQMQNEDQEYVLDKIKLFKI